MSLARQAGRNLYQYAYRDIIKTVTAHVSNLLMEHNCPTNLDGYFYLRDSVAATVKDCTCINCMTKRLYSDIAQTHDTTVENVEKCIRTLRNKWWSKGGLAELFPEKPSNKALIVRLAELACTNQAPEPQIPQPDFDELEKDAPQSVFEYILGLR